MRIWLSAASLCAIALHFAEAGTFRGVSSSKNDNSSAIPADNDNTSIDNVLDSKNVRHLTSCSAQILCPTVNDPCCSQWGFCGHTDPYCGVANCVSGCPAQQPPPSPLPTPLPTKNPVITPPINNSDNKLLNPGFEDVTLTPWHANSGTVAIDATTEAHSGSQSVLCKDRTATWMGVQQDVTTALEPNETYRFSCWAKLKNAVSDTFKMTLKIEDGNGLHWKGITTTINDSGWTFVEGEMNVDVTGQLAGVYLYMNGPLSGVEYWVDDVSVVSLSTALTSPGPTPVPTKSPTPWPTNLPTPSPTPSPTDPPSNQVLNPGFEDGLTNWQGKSGSVQIDTTEKHSGSQSVLCTDRTATWNGVQQHMIPGESIIPNAKYLVSCWAKLKNAPSDKLKLTVRIEDDTGKRFRGISTTINDNSWTLLEGYLTVEATGQVTSAKLFAEGPASGVEFWVDDFSAVFVEMVTLSPTTGGTPIPTNLPTPLPTNLPTSSPTKLPTPSPTNLPTNTPTHFPTKFPTSTPTNLPTFNPTNPPTPPPSYLLTPSPTNSLIPTIPTNPPSNHVYNPGFEDNTLTPWYANSGSAVVQIDSTQAHSGTQSALCKDRTATWMGVQQDVSTEGRVIANAKYHVSCWAKLKNAASDNFKITFRIEDDGEPRWRGITRTITNDSWTFVEGYITVEGVTGALSGVYMYLNGPGVGVEYWVDDVSVVFVAALTTSPSLPPTPIPTNLPTPEPTNVPTPPPVTMDRMLYCGVPSKCNELGGDEVVASMNDLHAVRCCTENANLNWPYKCLNTEGVWGESDVPTCYNSKTFNEATAICSSYDGGRLCTGDEMKDKCTAGTGCGANTKLVWGCTAVQGTCATDAECCTGLCDEGLCAGASPFEPTNNPTPMPTNAPTLQPTNKPTTHPSLKPTKSPTNQPTKKPTASSIYGGGPFVTLASSSEIVTIPRPLPGSSEPRTNCPHMENGLLSWHDAATWAPGNIPSAGEDVTLPNNSKVVITQSVAEELGVITVPSSSALIFGENDVAPITLDVHGMDVRGALRAGSETCRYNTELTITLHGSRPSDLNVYGVSSTAVPTYKGISVNGVISIHGKKKYPTWSRLAESVPIGQSYLLVQESVNWEVGQKIILTTTAIHDSRDGMNQNEVFTISSIVNSPVQGVGSAIHFTTPADYAHIANHAFQAEVGLLSRNIKIQGAAGDSDPTDPDTGNCSGQWHFGTNYAPCPNKYKTGFGGHIMVHSGGKGYVEGVELYRMGQTNVLGRYPFHFHVLGNDCADCYFNENSIHRSYYRCISIHGTHSTTVSENVAYDVSGYCYYLEDGVEEENTISFNLAAHIHPVSNIIANAGGGQTIPTFLQTRDLILPADVTASGFYLTNLHNNIIGNAASGGWAGFALPVLHSPVGAHKDVNMRPGNRLTKIFDGNTAHSTGWWWGHAGAIYSGGSLYYNNADPTLLEYNAGRDQSKGNRSPCLVDKCVENNDCNSYCFEGERAWFQLTNTKVFLSASPGLNSWSGGMEITHFEAHDVALGLESLSGTGFGIRNLLVECRSGEEWVMPGNPSGVSANGFFWYDTNQEHIITTATFRNCGARKSSNFYDSSSTRGCSTNSFNGCTSSSSVWGFITHSDQHTPELMQATTSITYEDCGTRFRLYDYADQNVISSVSSRTQNWMDLDGTASGLDEPTIIGSGLTDAGHWWRVEDSVVDDPEGPLIFIKKNDGPERGLGHIRFRFDDNLFNSVGQSACKNGPKKDGAGNLLCPAIGRVRHIGPLFDSSNDPSGGLPITANAIVAGPTGGFGWVLNLDAGPPKSLRIDQIEVDSSTKLMLAIPYPAGTSFSISAHAPWCSSIPTHSCTEQFTAADSISHVRYSQGNKYYYDTYTKLLYIRVIMFPLTYTGDNLNSPTAMWHLWDLDDPNNKPWDNRQHALDRYSFNGVTLPKYSNGNYLQITADCNPGSASLYCADTPSYIEPEVCQSGYVQVSFDKCCVPPEYTNCYDFTAPPTRAPTSPPTFGSNSNLFYNSGFEDSTVNPWYANAGTVQIHTTQKHSGSQSVLCKDRTADWNGVEQDLGGRFVANATYRVSCWAKLKNVGSATLKMTLKTVDDNGPHWKGISKTINNYSWTFVEGDLTVDAAGALSDVDLYINGPGSGVEFWVDDVSAVLVP